jgi:hypothetical protein
MSYVTPPESEVPQSYTRAEYSDLIESITGYPASMVPDHGLEFRGDGIHARIFRLNDKGNQFVEDDSDELSTRALHIPVVDRP